MFHSFNYPRKNINLHEKLAQVCWLWLDPTTCSSKQVPLKIVLQPRVIDHRSTENRTAIHAIREISSSINLIASCRFHFHSHWMILTIKYQAHFFSFIHPTFPRPARLHTRGRRIRIPLKEYKRREERAREVASKKSRSCVARYSDSCEMPSRPGYNSIREQWGE